MKKEKLSDIISELDSTVIAESADYKQRSNGANMAKRIAVAACIVLAVSVGSVFGYNAYKQNTPAILPDNTTNNTLQPNGTLQRNYKNTVVAENSALLWRWEYLSPEEKYLSLELNGAEFNSRNQEIAPAFVHSLLGSYVARGYDYYENNKEYSQVFEVYSIKNVSEKCRVAAKIDGKYYVYGNSDGIKPSNFGDLFDALGLEKTASVNGFSVNDGKSNNEYRALKDGAFLWQMLSQCKSAPIADGSANIQNEQSPVGQGKSPPAYNPGLPVANDFSLSGRKYISFTVSSESIGANKLSLAVTEDGFVWTNIGDYGYAFEIGKESAKQIIDYAKANSVPAEPEPYQYSIIGKVTEISDGYVLVDDSEMCVNKAEGRVFKVLTDSIKIKRCFEFEPYGIKTGSIVIISFRQPIAVNEDNTLSGAVDVQKGIVTGGGEYIIAE